MSMYALFPVALTLAAGTGLDWGAEISWHDQHRIEQLGLLVVIALGAPFLWRQSLLAAVECIPEKSRFALASAFGLGLVSLTTADYPRYAGLEWATLLLLLGLVLVLAGQMRLGGDRSDTWAIRLVLALSVVIALKVMMGYVASIVEGVRLDTLALFEGTFSNRRMFGQVASLVIPLLAYPLLKRDFPRGQRGSVFALLAIWWMLVIVSGTRGTWMALAVSASVLAVISWRTCRAWLGVQVVALAFGMFLFLFLFYWLPGWLGLVPRLENRLADFSALNGRAELWALAWEQIQAHPWLGVGPMHLAAIRNDFGAHPHNAVLQLAAEWGVPAALALILPVVAGMLSLLARLRNEVVPNVLLVCLTASLLAASAQSMVDGVIVIPYTQTLLALVAGWALGVYFRGAVVAPAVSGSRILRLGLPIFFMCVLVALLNGVFPEVLNRDEITQAYVSSGNVLVPPRYWAVGWIP